jgi:hypothetical protein
VIFSCILCRTKGIWTIRVLAVNVWADYICVSRFWLPDLLLYVYTCVYLFYRVLITYHRWNVRYYIWVMNMSEYIYFGINILGEFIIPNPRSSYFIVLTYITLRMYINSSHSNLEPKTRWLLLLPGHLLNYDQRGLC